MDSASRRFGVSASDIRKTNWKVVLDQHPVKKCHSYAGALATASKVAKEHGDETGAQCFRLLQAIASFHPNYEATGNPYGPLATFTDGNRTLMAEDLDDGDLLALKELLIEITEPNFRARVADVLWTTKKDFQAAKIAVESFIEAAQQADDKEHWFHSIESLKRAGQISARKGFDDAKKGVVIAVREKLEEFSKDHDHYGLACGHLIQLLVNIGEGSQADAGFSEKMAVLFATKGNWHLAMQYWAIATHCYRNLKDDAATQRCRIEMGRAQISRGEAGLTQGMPSKFLYAQHWIKQGFETLRQASASPEQIQKTLQRLLEVQQLAKQEFQPTEIDVDQIPGFREAESESQKKAIEVVAGHPVEEAIFRFILLGKPTDVAALEKQHEEDSNGLIFHKLGGVTAHDITGKVADKIAPDGVGTSKQQEEAKRKILIEEATRKNWQMLVKWRLEPARRAIMAEHNVRLVDIASLLFGNPFVPPGHEGIYLRGFQAGFYGDWLIAMHLIIPQLEASIRYILQQHKVITSKVHGDGTQEEYNLNDFLWMRETIKIFGPDVIFDLRGLLIEHFGYNLRNNLAHGLMPEGAFYQDHACHIWWLTMWLCLHGQHWSPNAPSS